MARYSRNAEFVDAAQWFNPGDHEAVVLRQPLGDLATHTVPVPWLAHPSGGGQVVYAGDWIVTDQFGHRYAISNPAFRALFHAVGEDVHPDDIAVDRFAKRRQGRGGWQDKESCSGPFLSSLLVEHVEKGDPIDVANFSMMIHQRGEQIAGERERYIDMKLRERRDREEAERQSGNGDSQASVAI
ncbi:hypothetical protein HFO56_02765 [Rhizobium laguerreae]|uniref:hypothetical protein n=1 Tax=Rhizobium laguerreae TaxID=1076926 RepID=UPI001C92992D|nr:hypothetical protein [Rhizobium laguerreae]MBY3151308.1 hypothetical protein [Rhizobium laguerreae]